MREETIKLIEDIQKEIDKLQKIINNYRATSPEFGYANGKIYAYEQVLMRLKMM